MAVTNAKKKPRKVVKKTRKIPKVGDRIKFTVATRQGMESATRIVKGLWRYNDGGYLVGFRGYTEFIVKPSEVTEVIRATKK